MAASSSDPTSEPLVEVRFVTNLDERWRVPDAPLQLPTRLMRTGLSEVINHLLSATNSSHESRPFDFLINNELLRVNLGAALAKHGISGEAIAEIEYVEMIPPPQPKPTCAHQDWVSALAAHPSGGGMLLSGCYNNCAYVWDANGRQIAELSGHSGAVKAVAWLKGDASAPGVLRAATASKDLTVRTWRLGPMPQQDADAVPPTACEAALVGHTAAVEALCANPSGDRLCSGASDGGLLVWAAGEPPPATGEGGEAGNSGAGAGAARASKRSKGAKGTISSTAMPVPEVSPSSSLSESHAGSVNALCWPTAALMYSGSWDGQIKEWQVDVESSSATLGGQAAVIALDVSLSSQLMASGHTDHVLRVWDSRLQAAAMQLKLPHKGWVSAVRWCPQQANMLASASYDGAVRLWDVRSSAPLHTVSTHEGKALCLAWDGADRIASGGSDAQMRIAAITLPGLA